MNTNKTPSRPNDLIRLISALYVPARPARVVLEVGGQRYARNGAAWDRHISEIQRHANRCIALYEAEKHHYTDVLLPVRQR